MVLPLSPLVLAPIPAAAATGLSVGTNTSMFREPVAPYALHIFGEVSNAPNSDRARYVRVTCTIYDINNTVLAFETTGTTADILLGGESDATITVGIDSTTDFVADVSGCPLAPAKLAAGTSCPIVVTFAPSDVGLRSATLTITATDDGNNAARNSPLQITLQGTGINATATVSPTSLSFGSVAIGANSAGKAVTLTSTGTGPVQIANIVITGANSEEFSRVGDCPSSLDPGNHCTITVTFTPLTGGDKSASLTIVDNAGGGSQVVPLTGHGIASTTFYFAEGFTGAGFTETLSILTPSQSGTATIDYYTELGHLPTVVRSVTAGHVLVEDVNADVLAGHQVSARVILSVPGVVERVMHFNNGTWFGSTDKVGASAPSTSWYFAEGSTLSAFAEYLSIQNPNPSDVVVDLTYATGRNQHPVKTLTVPANTRITVAVGLGNWPTMATAIRCSPAAWGAGWWGSRFRSARARCRSWRSARCT